MDEQALRLPPAPAGRPGRVPTDPREFADEMVRDGVLTNFQSEQFLPR